MSNLTPPQKFCASPWVEGVIRISGNMTPCCKNPIAIGKWQDEGIEKLWVSERYQRFRRDIIEGRFPNVFCATCYNNGTAQSLRQLTQKPLNEYVNALHRLYPKVFAFKQLKQLWNKTELDGEAAEILRVYFRNLELCEASIARGAVPAEANIYVKKLRVLGTIMRDFLAGETAPTKVAPLRQAHLIAICNARCIQCPGLFTKEIESGIKVPGSDQPFKEMTSEQVEGSFARSEDIVDFFMGGSEFLFAKTWPQVAARLKREGLRVRISTNGMLLAEKNARLLIDNDYLGKLNLSLDGASPEMIERIRVRVKYDRVMDNLKFMLPYAAERDTHFAMSMTFALMNINYHELPDFVDLAARVADLNPRIRPVVMVQPLSQKGAEGYREFVSRHHASLVPHDKIVEAFLLMRDRAKAAGLRVLVFFKHELDEFIDRGCPIPALNFAGHSEFYDELEEQS